ncbi:hypothetical protein HAX54_053161 [Datura stramonium]|uniref:Uncharacterized protein n=1 Tax=Datura stramonium TaxID=4076 RepID=A0ABS8SZX4_DATST|nr:hypothetical protein [Datura stramonium]
MVLTKVTSEDKIGFFTMVDGSSVNSDYSSSSANDITPPRRFIGNAYSLKFYPSLMAPVAVSMSELFGLCNWTPSLGSTVGHNVISNSWTSSLSLTMGNNVISNNWTPNLGPTMSHNMTAVIGPSLGSTMYHAVVVVMGPKPWLDYRP